MALSAARLTALPVGAEANPVPASKQTQAPGDPSTSDVSLVVGKSVVISSDRSIERVSIGLGDVAEVTAVSPYEVLLNAKTPGSTSMIIWQKGGGKQLFDVNVRPNPFMANARLASIRREIANELPDQNIIVSSENDVIFLRGTVRDVISSQRAVAIASTSGKVVNLMYVDVPPPQAQILLKVRFASIDRSNTTDLAFHLFSTGAGNTVGAIGTQQFGSPQLQTTPQQTPTAPLVFSDILNLFVYNKNIDLGALVKALETKGVLEMLAEPNLLAENGKQASFLAGGEFPYPVFQGSVAGGTGAITIQFQEFGVRLNFIPTLTPDGNIRLQVAPEVSSLDFTDGLTIQGYTVPALNVRRVQTVVDLQDGQSFAISGLLDRSVAKTLEKVPFIGDIPILGKLFHSKNDVRTNSELLVFVTPVIVRPTPAGAPPVDLHYPVPFLPPLPGTTAQVPGQVLPAGPAAPPNQTIPIESLLESLKPEQPMVVKSNTGAPNSSAPPSGSSPQP